MKTLLMSTAALVLLGGCEYMPDWMDQDADNEAVVADAVTEDAIVETASEPVAEVVSMPEAEMENPFTALLTHADRPAADAEDDAARKPDAVLEFSGVEAGMSVYELEAGGGYYTELLSRVVGSEGSVVMLNPPGFDAFLGDSVDRRLADDRLANVTLRKANFDDLGAAAGSQDMVTWFLGPHELWYTPDGAEPDVLGDPVGVFDMIANALKPGGLFVVLDHSSHAGDPATTGGIVHRIDKAIIIELAQDAGLTMIEESDVLANPNDDHSVIVFDPAVRRNTDRFLLKFRK